MKLSAIINACIATAHQVSETGVATAEEILHTIQAVGAFFSHHPEVVKAMQVGAEVGLAATGAAPADIALAAASANALQTLADASTAPVHTTQSVLNIAAAAKSIAEASGNQDIANHIDKTVHAVLQNQPVVQ